MSTSVDPSPYEELTNSRFKLTSSSPFIPTYVQSHLQKSANLNPKAVYESRVKGRRIFLEKKTSASDGRVKMERDAKRTRRAQDKEKRKLGVIGKGEAAAKGVWKLDDSHAKYNLLLPLHHLWRGYMAELLGLNPPPPSPSTSVHTMPNAAGMHAKLVKADFHGSIMTVRRSKNPNLVGLSGIVVHETENAFKVITTQDKIKVLPKQNSVFAFRVPLYDAGIPTMTPAASRDAISNATTDPQIEFELYGNQFCFRAAERSGRKFKHKETIAL